MARQEGVILFTGSIGNLSFYKLNGAYYVRRKSGVSRERIMTEPVYERTRANIAEFTHASQATKLIRQAFASLFKTAGDKHVSSRLTGMVSKVVKSDPINTHGKRTIMNGDNGHLQGFNLHKDRNLSALLLAQYTPFIDRTTGVMSVDIAPFSPDKMIAAPKGATHFRLIAAGAAIDFDTNTFSATTSESTDIPVNARAKEPLQLKLTVPPSAHPMFLLFGIEFLQSVNGTQHSLGSGHAVKIVKVDTFDPHQSGSGHEKAVLTRTLSRPDVKNRQPVERTLLKREKPVVYERLACGEQSLEEANACGANALGRWAIFLHPT